MTMTSSLGTVMVALVAVLGIWPLLTQAADISVVIASDWDCSHLTILDDETLYIYYSAAGTSTICSYLVDTPQPENDICIDIQGFHTQTACEIEMRFYLSSYLAVTSQADENYRCEAAVTTWCTPYNNARIEFERLDYTVYPTVYIQLRVYVGLYNTSDNNSNTDSEDEYTSVEAIIGYSAGAIIFIIGITVLVVCLASKGRLCKGLCHGSSTSPGHTTATVSPGNNAQNATSRVHNMSQTGQPYYMNYAGQAQPNYNSFLPRPSFGTAQSNIQNYEQSSYPLQLQPSFRQTNYPEQSQSSSLPPLRGQLLHQPPSYEEAMGFSAHPASNAWGSHGRTATMPSAPPEEP